MQNSFEQSLQSIRACSSVDANKPVYRSEDLFKNDREIIITHKECQYRLKITKAGKLILTK